MTLRQVQWPLPVKWIIYGFARENLNKKRSGHIYPHMLGEAQDTSLLASLGSVVRWRTLKPSTCQIPWNHSPPNLLSQLTARLEFLPESLDKPMFDVLLTWLTFKKAVPNSWQCFINFPPHKPHQIPLTPSNSPISKGPHPAEGWGSTWKSLSICHQLHLPLGSCSHRYLPNSLKCSSRMPYCFTSNNLPYHHRWASETPARSGNLNTNSRPKKPFGCWIWDMHQKPLMHRQESRPARSLHPIWFVLEKLWGCSKPLSRPTMNFKPF